MSTHAVTEKQQHFTQGHYEFVFGLAHAVRRSNTTKFSLLGKQHRCGMNDEQQDNAIK